MATCIDILSWSCTIIIILVDSIHYAKSSPTWVFSRSFLMFSVGLQSLTHCWKYFKCFCKVQSCLAAICHPTVSLFSKIHLFLVVTILFLENVVNFLQIFLTQACWILWDVEPTEIFPELAAICDHCCNFNIFIKSQTSFGYLLLDLESIVLYLYFFVLFTFL